MFIPKSSCYISCRKCGTTNKDKIRRILKNPSHDYLLSTISTNSPLRFFCSAILNISSEVPL